MARLLFTLLLTLCSFWASAQEGRLVNGLVTSGDFLLEGTHVSNVTTGEATLTNSEGEFSLRISVGDTLVFSHISMQDLIKFVEKEEVKQDPMAVNMVERNNELDEVELEDNRDYALELGIISERKEKLSVNERRLKTAGDFKPIQLLGLLGGSLPLDPILNAINGRTKKLKRNVQVEQKSAWINFLRQQYLDFMIESFESSQKDIEPFLDYLVEQESLEPVMATKNQDQMKFYLIDEWFKYQGRK